MHDSAKGGAPLQGLSQKRTIRATVFDYGNVLGLEQTLEVVNGMALVCGIPHERFSNLYWKLPPPYDRGDIDGQSDWKAVIGQQEPGLRRDQVVTRIKLDTESINRPNQGAMQWAKLLHHEGFGLALLSNMPLERSDRAENVEAAACLGINSVLLDTVEKTASRVESPFDNPVPTYGRCRQSSSECSPTHRRPDRMESD